MLSFDVLSYFVAQRRFTPPRPPRISAHQADMLELLQRDGEIVLPRAGRTAQALIRGDFAYRTATVGTEYARFTLTPALRLPGVAPWRTP